MFSMQLERMKNENSLLQDNHDFHQKFPTLEREFMQLQKVNKLLSLVSYNVVVPFIGALNFCCFIRPMQNWEACSPCSMNFQKVAMRQKGCLHQKLSLQKLCRQRSNQVSIFRGMPSIIAMKSLGKLESYCISGSRENLSPYFIRLFSFKCALFAVCLTKPEIWYFTIERRPKRKKPNCLWN